VKRWYPTQLPFPGYDENGPFTLIMGGSAVGQDPSNWWDVYQNMDVFFPYSKTDKQMYEFGSTQFTRRIGNLNMYPFLYLLPAWHEGKYQMYTCRPVYTEHRGVGIPSTESSRPPDFCRVFGAHTRHLCSAESTL
jgi:hypothetical protein